MTYVRSAIVEVEESTEKDYTSSQILCDSIEAQLQELPENKDMGVMISLKSPI